MTVDDLAPNVVRKLKIENKKKFKFEESDVLPPSRKLIGKNSFQNRLSRKADDKLSYDEDSGRGENKKVIFSYPQKNPISYSKGKSYEVVKDDPVLDEIVSKLKRRCYISKDNTSKFYEKSDVMIKNFGAGDTGVNLNPSKVGRQPSLDDCTCSRPLKLVMCELCGETFRGRVKRVCNRHPKALYLQDVGECRKCKQDNVMKLKEFDLPPGMMFTKC